MEITKYKRSISAYITVFVIAIVSLPLLSSFLIGHVSYDYQPSLDKTQKLDSSTSLSQSFVAKDSLLTGIGMSIKNPNFTNKTDVIIQVYDQNKVKLGEGVLNGANIADGDFVKFNLSQILLNVGQKYFFELSSPATPKETPYGVYLSANSDFENYLVNGVVDEGSISYVAFYKPQSHTGLVLKIYKGWFAKLFSDKPFFYFYGGLLLVLSLPVVVKRESS
jgi:hypothetical protein